MTADRRSFLKNHRGFIGCLMEEIFELEPCGGGKNEAIASGHESVSVGCLL
jgi:hypothetical protein